MRRTVYLEQFAGCESLALTGIGTEIDQLEALYLENFIQSTICNIQFIFNGEFEHVLKHVKQCHLQSFH